MGIEQPGRHIGLPAQPCCDLATVCSVLLGAVVISGAVGATPWLLALPLAGYGMALGFTLPAQPALMISWFPGLRGTAVALYNSARFLGGAAGPVAIGMVADAQGLAIAFAAPPIMLLGATLAVLAWIHDPPAADSSA